MFRNSDQIVTCHSDQRRRRGGWQAVFLRVDKILGLDLHHTLVFGRTEWETNPIRLLQSRAPTRRKPEWIQCQAEAFSASLCSRWDSRAAASVPAMPCCSAEMTSGSLRRLRRRENIAGDRNSAPAPGSRVSEGKQSHLLKHPGGVTCRSRR